MSLAMSLVMSCQMVRRQLKDKFRVIWDRNTQTKQGEHTHTHTDTLLISNVAFSLSSSLTQTHGTHHTVYCPRTHRHKPQIYTTLIHSILYTCPRSCEVISSHADTLSRDTFSKAWIRHTQTHAYKYMYMYTCKHSRGFYSSSNHLKWEKRGLTRAVMFLCHVVKISICHTEGLLAGIKGCFI